MVEITIKIFDEKVNGLEAARIKVSHNIKPSESDLGVTSAMRAAAHLVQAFKDFGRPVGEAETILTGMEKVAAETPAVLMPYGGVPDSVA